MDSVAAVGTCLAHSDRTGTPCGRCGTFRCGECLADWLCPDCRSGIAARPVQSEDTVGFGRRAGSRMIEMVVGQVVGLAGGLAAGVALVVLEATGVARAGWAQRLDHGLLFNILVGLSASILGMTVSTWVCGASPGKVILGLRVIRVDGKPAGLGAAFVRELAYLVDSFFFGLVAKGAMDGSALQQRKGDQWAGTTVVRAATLPSSVTASTGMLIIGITLGLFVNGLVLAFFFVVGAL